MMMFIIPCCGTCRYGVSIDPDRVICGAGVDTDNPSNNPIWAERKYNKARVMNLLLGMETKTPYGSDSSTLHPDDGKDCAVYGEKESKLTTENVYIEYSIIGDPRIHRVIERTIEKRDA